MSSTINPLYIILFLLVSLGIVWFLAHRNKKDKSTKEDSQTQMLTKAFEISEDMVIVFGLSGEVMYANPPMVKLLNLGNTYKNKKLDKPPKVKIKDEWIGLNEFMHTNSARPTKDTFSFSRIELDVNKEQTKSFNLSFSKNREKQNNWEYIVSLHDLSKEEELRASEHLHKVTKLPNQTLAMNDLTEMWGKIHLLNEKIALVLIEIDNFSKLRSLLGYEQTNKIMIKLAQYFTSKAKRYTAKVYHTYPNNFLVIMTQVGDVQVVLNFVNEIQADLKEFYRMKDISLHLTASVGISIYPDSGSARNLLDNAYKALGEAEAQGHGQSHLYVQEKKKFAFDDLTLHSEMHQALARGEFQVYYQPIMESKANELVGAEALIRWIHPKHGLIPTDAFIPIMEKTGFIIELGKFILGEVLQQQKRWEQFGFKRIYVSINASMIEFEAEDFVANVGKRLKEFKVDPELIVFEVTEGNAMVSEKHTLKEFQKLRDMGVGIYLDDFGTGYTSFSYLKKFPATALKIDKSLIDYILTKEDDQRIVQAMIDLAHNLEMKVVVEGIENKKMADLLQTYGCDYFQGYYFSKPLPLFEFQKFLRPDKIH